MLIQAAFVRSAASARDLPQDGLAEIALVGRSNVGKSSLINALVRQRIARTSAAPGKTRLANLYRVARSGGESFYLVDLPGYGYARGRDASAREFEALTRAYFDVGQDGRDRQDRRDGKNSSARNVSALLLVDARHPGLESDVQAWHWVRETVAESVIVATKIDKLARGERIRALREIESVLEDSVLPVSAVTGEGMDQLWKAIEHLRRNSRPPRDNSRRSNNNSSSSNPVPTARPPLRHLKN